MNSIRLRRRGDLYRFPRYPRYPRYPGLLTELLCFVEVTIVPVSPIAWLTKCLHKWMVLKDWMGYMFLRPPGVLSRVVSSADAGCTYAFVT